MSKIEILIDKMDAKRKELSETVKIGLMYFFGLEEFAESLEAVDYYEAYVCQAIYIATGGDDFNMFLRDADNIAFVRNALGEEKFKLDIAIIKLITELYVDREEVEYYLDRANRSYEKFKKKNLN